jgi:SRSO17 transposase
VPPEVEFRTKGMIALAEIDELLAEEIPLAPVVADAGYGASTAFREALTERGFSYAVGILPDTSLWAPGEEPLPPRPWKGQGRPPKLLRRSTERQRT